MIVVCPTCATRHDVPDGHFGPEGTMMSCAVCGHGWIESRALRIVEPRPREAYHALERHDDIVEEREVMRLAQAALAAQAQYAQAKIKRRKERRGWAMLAAAIILPA